MPEHDVTRLLRAMNQGDDEARAHLVAAVYHELRQLARAQLRRERTDHSLHPTDLVHEAYLRLARGKATWQNRAHFFGAAAVAMRRVLVDHARKRKAARRGGDRQLVTLGDVAAGSEDPDVDVLALDEALTALAAKDDRLSKLVHLRYFAGCSIAETAELLGVSPATVKRDWTYARAWLYERMSH